jgi:hypothetical protein
MRLPARRAAAAIFALAIPGCGLGPVGAADVALSGAAAYTQADEVAAMLRSFDLPDADRRALGAALDRLEAIRAEVRGLVTDPGLDSARLTLEAAAWYSQARAQVQTIERLVESHADELTAGQRARLAAYRRDLRVIGAAVLDALEAADRSELWRQWQAWAALIARAHYISQSAGEPQ